MRFRILVFSFSDVTIYTITTTVFSYVSFFRAPSCVFGMIHNVNTVGDRGSDDTSDISITGSTVVVSSVIDRSRLLS